MYVWLSVFLSVCLALFLLGLVFVTWSVIFHTLAINQTTFSDSVIPINSDANVHAINSLILKLDSCLNLLQHQ